MSKFLFALALSALSVAGASAQVYQSGGVYYPNQPANGVVQTGSVVNGVPTVPGQTVVNGVVTQTPYLTPQTSYSQPMTSYSQPMTMNYNQPTVMNGTVYGGNVVSSYPVVSSNVVRSTVPAYTTPLSTGYYPDMMYPTTTYSSYRNSTNYPTTVYPATATTQGGFFNGNSGGLVGTTTNFAGQVVRAPFTVVRRVGGIFR